MTPLVRNVSDEAQVGEAEKKVKRTALLEDTDLRFVLSSPEGRRFVWRLLSLTDRISAGADPHMTYFRDGERNQAIVLKARIVHKYPDLYLRMEHEYIKSLGDNND